MEGPFQDWLCSGCASSQRAEEARMVDGASLRTIMYVYSIREKGGIMYNRDVSMCERKKKRWHLVHHVF